MKKKRNAIILKIKEPCSQDISQMTPLPGGRHCDLCERTIVDFSEMTDREIVRIYQQRQGRVCGIFTPHQLGRALPLPQPPKETRPWAAIAALTSTLLLGSAAENRAETPQSFVSIAGNQVQLEDKITIEGFVYDENGEPLYGATVQSIDGSGTTTDIDGSFKLTLDKLLANAPITISFMGYEPMKIALSEFISNEQPLEIAIKPGLNLPDVVVTAYGPNHTKGLLTISGLISSGYSHEDGNEEAKVETVDIQEIKAFPNPFINTINVELNIGNAENYLFHLYNESGQLVFATTVEIAVGPQFIQLDLLQRHLPEGIYFLRISDSLGEIRTKRLVKVSP